MNANHSQKVIKRIRARVGFVYSELGELANQTAQLSEDDRSRICSELASLSEQFAIVDILVHAEA